MGILITGWIPKYHKLFFLSVPRVTLGCYSGRRCGRWTVTTPFKVILASLTLLVSNFWFCSASDIYLELQVTYNLDYVKKLKGKGLFALRVRSLVLLDNTGLISGTLPVKIYGVCQLTLSCTWPFACRDLWLLPRFWFLSMSPLAKSRKKKKSLNSEIRCSRFSLATYKGV